MVKRVPRVGVLNARVGELLVDLQDVALLPSRACSSTTFFKDCGRGESLRTTTCLKTVVGVSQGILHIKYFYSNKAFFVSVESHGDH